MKLLLIPKYPVKPCNYYTYLDLGELKKVDPIYKMLDLKKENQVKVLHTS